MASFTRKHDKHGGNCEKLPGEHLIGCQGVKLFPIKDVSIIITPATI